MNTLSSIASTIIQQSHFIFSFFNKKKNIQPNSCPSIDNTNIIFPKFDTIYLKLNV